MASIKKITTLTSLALVAALSLTGCGGDAPNSAGNTGGGTTTQTAASELTAENFAQRINDAQLEAGSFSMLMETTQGGMSVTMNAEAKVSENISDTAMRMVMDMAELGGEMEMLMIGTDLYMNMGELSDNKFALFPADQMGALGLDELEAQTNPAAQFELYEKALTDFSVDGTETIDGVETTKYTLTLDTKIIMGESGQDLPQEALDVIGETMTYSMFIDAQDLPKRIVMDLGDGETVVTFSDWGKDVQIDAPAADQLTDLGF